MNNCYKRINFMLNIGKNIRANNEINYLKKIYVIFLL